MTNILIALAVLCIVLAILAARIGKNQKLHYTAKNVMTKTEQILYYKIKEALPEFIVLP
ncbi:MAG: hypothetical protein LBU76_00555 [Azoarcus sp.]|jgi:hypothetical protein|nr:hypothetical protein [Azoarcus sp.]